jgi:hypothetical protein
MRTVFSIPRDIDTQYVHMTVNMILDTFFTDSLSHFLTLSLSTCMCLLSLCLCVSLVSLSRKRLPAPFPSTFSPPLMYVYKQQ